MKYGGCIIIEAVQNFLLTWEIKYRSGLTKVRSLLIQPNFGHMYLFYGFILQVCLLCLYAVYFFPSLF